MQLSFAQQLAGKSLLKKPCERSQVYARAERQYWYPNAKNIPDWLDGSMPGDRGFDPMGFCSYAPMKNWYQQAELQNGRWAMLCVAGIVAQELVGAPKWYEVGAVANNGVDDRVLLAIEIGTFCCVENLRLQGWKRNQDNAWYSNFDPLGLGKNEDMKVREIKNGRLAMIAFIGFNLQALIAREGPIEGLMNHMADPFGHNIIQNVYHIGDTIIKNYPEQAAIKLQQALS